MTIRYLLCAIIGYLLGSISTGILYSKYFLGRDVRTAGSNNSGASNMLRVHGLKPGLITFAGDSAKAMISILIGSWLAGQNGALIAGLTVVLGHNWPVFFSFQGGKGIACCTAVYVFTFPLFGVLSIIPAVLTVWLTRYISLGSITMTVIFALLIILFKPFWPVGVWAIVLMLLAIYRHRSNIQRLFKGTERKIGEREKL